MNLPAQLPAGLLDEISLGSARGGKRADIPVEITVIRELTPNDLPAIQAPPVVAASLPVVAQLRHSHHRLAELIAKGLPGTEISLITGYSQSYISNIQRDPAMRELIAYYEAQKESIFIDAMERLRVLGIDGIEALQAKLDDPEIKWSPRELMELVEMAVVKPTAAAQARPGNSGPGPSVSLEVKFVGARPRDDQVIEVQAREVRDDR